MKIGNVSQSGDHVRRTTQSNNILHHIPSGHWMLGMGTGEGLHSMAKLTIVKPPLQSAMDHVGKQLPQPATTVGGCRAPKQGPCLPVDGTRASGNVETHPIVRYTFGGDAQDLKCLCVIEGAKDRTRSAYHGVLYGWLDTQCTMCRASLQPTLIRASSCKVSTPCGCFFLFARHGYLLQLQNKHIDTHTTATKPHSDNVFGTMDPHDDDITVELPIGTLSRILKVTQFHKHVQII